MVVWLSISQNKNVINWSDFTRLLRDDQLKEVIQVGDRFEGELKEGVREKLPDELKKRMPTTKFSVERLQGTDLDIQKLLYDKASKDLVVLAKPTYNWLSSAVLFLIPLSILVVFIFFFLPRMRDPLGGGFLNNYIKSPAKRYERSKLRVTFEDVAGLLNAKSELQEIVEFLRSPEKFASASARSSPRVCCSSVRRAPARRCSLAPSPGEAGVPFFTINGSEFIQMFVGVGASRVRDMFKTAKENAPVHSVHR